jgi:hypothetical protein
VPNKPIIIFLVLLSLTICLGEFVMGGVTLKYCEALYISSIFAPVVMFAVVLYPTNHIDVEPYPWFPVKWLVLLSLASFIVSCYISSDGWGTYQYLLTLKACVNEDFSNYYGEVDFRKSAYYCQVCLSYCAYIQGE